MFTNIRQRIPNVRWLASWIIPLPHKPLSFKVVFDYSMGSDVYAQWNGILWMGRPRRMSYRIS